MRTVTISLPVLPIDRLLMGDIERAISTADSTAMRFEVILPTRPGDEPEMSREEMYAALFAEAEA